MIDPKKDITSHMIIESKKNDVHLNKDRAHGFWTLGLSEGSLPEKYRGKYSQFREAKVAAEKFMSEKKMVPTVPIHPVIKV